MLMELNPIIISANEFLAKEQDEINSNSLRYGHVIKTDINIHSQGKWFGNTWKLLLVAPDAKSIDLLLKDIKLPEGAEINIYDVNGKMNFGPIKNYHIINGFPLATDINSINTNSTLASISGGESVCTSGVSYQLSQELGDVAYSWELTPSGLFSSPTSGTGASVTAYPFISPCSGSGQIRFYNECDSYTKTVWVGAPYINPNTIEFYNSEASTGKLCANAFGNDFSFTTSSEWSSFDIKLTNLAETQTICSFTIYDTQGDLDLCSVSNGTYMFWVRGTNDCGTASNWSKTSVEYEDCGGQFFLLMTPNPSSSQTTLSIVSTSTEKVDEAVEWELEVFDATQNLKEKKVKIKGTEIEINTGNWKDGVYLIRVNYNNEILQGKLVVKK